MVIMTFNSLSLDPKILKALTESGYTEPTKIQEKAIPRILAGVDIRASAQTGTGKTAAFLLPTLHHLLTREAKPMRGPRVLIVAPTRELAIQISGQIEKYAKFLPQTKAVCICGGVSYQIENRKLSRPYEILIATPGRLIDYMKQRRIDLSKVEVLILDEADRMLDMGFLEPVREIVAALPKSRQTLLFSATLQGRIMKVSEEFLKSPEDIAIHVEREKHENITQKLYYVDNMGHKNRLLEHILNEEDVKYAIIFSATKRHADQLVRELREKGHKAAPLHGDMSQNQRMRTTAKLREGKIEVLVATDVAARGLDVNLITHVINFDLPRNVEDYVHRIGRTGRAGANGTAVSFAADRDFGLVHRIEKFTGQPIDVKEIEGLEPSKQKSPRRGPPSRGGGGGGNRGGGRSKSSRFNPQENKRFKPKFKPRRDSKSKVYA